MNSYFKPAAEGIKNMWQQIRTVAINHWGVIKQGTYESRTNKELFEDLKKHKPDEDNFRLGNKQIGKRCYAGRRCCIQRIQQVPTRMLHQKKNKSDAALEKDELHQELQKIALDRQKKSDYNSICVPSIIL